MNELSPKIMSNTTDKYIIITFFIVHETPIHCYHTCCNWKLFLKVHDHDLLGSCPEISCWKQYSEFNLTFEKWFMSFPNEYNSEYHKYCPLWLGGKKKFYSRLAKMVLDSIFVPFRLTGKHQICILCQKMFIRKELY